ncbi:lysozyme inhibitor LprI family protein [Ralstonia chuxiongensis]|uniref:hypothetical protein n=1 Tax=Ralstonia chuxiongensis TaxID=2957504 RepID=UPI002931963D|nr:hypothetical protein [Ralstonia chuxiongensis]
MMKKNYKLLILIHALALLVGQVDACEDRFEASVFSERGRDVSPIFQTNFDCENAVHNIEYLICHDAELAYYDMKLAEVEKAARTAATDPVEIEKHIQRQRYIRSQFCIDKECLKIWYSKQMEAMAYVVRMKKMPK